MKFNMLLELLKLVFAILLIIKLWKTIITTENRIVLMICTLISVFMMLGGLDCLFGF